jgi:outer membrane protein OmpA-like peptidoglycan-associated protein
VTVLALLALDAAAAQPVSRADHPLVARYEGSAIADSKVVEFGEYKLVTGRTAKGDPDGETVKGKVTRIVYENPAGRSTLEIFTNYEQALKKAGLTTLFACALDECGPAYTRSTWNRYNGLFAAADGDPRYLGGKLATDGGTAYVAVMVGRKRTQLDIVEIKGMQENMVAVDAAALAQGIDRDGRVSVYGILFDTDRTEIKPESKPALDQIAALLRERPALALYVVGHTDMTGSLQHNRTLSEGRARSVVKALVDGYGVAATRLEGYGVGPLAPVATNASDSGRAKNRRVELVAR